MGLKILILLSLLFGTLIGFVFGIFYVYVLVIWFIVSIIIAVEKINPLIQTTKIPIPRLSNPIRYLNKLLKFKWGKIFFLMFVWFIGFFIGSYLIPVIF